MASHHLSSRRRRCQALLDAGAGRGMLAAREGQPPQAGEREGEAPDRAGLRKILALSSYRRSGRRRIDRRSVASPSEEECHAVVPRLAHLAAETEALVQPRAGCASWPRRTVQRPQIERRQGDAHAVTLGPGERHTLLQLRRRVWVGTMEVVEHRQAEERPRPLPVAQRSRLASTSCIAGVSQARHSDQ